MKITNHPELKKEYSLVENTQYLPNKMAVLLKENDVVYKITPWMFCREFINDVVVSLNNGKSCKIYGLDTLPILYDENKHTLGFSINRIKNKDEFTNIILQIPELIKNISGIQLGIHIWNYNNSADSNTIHTLFSNLDIKKPALVSFISYLFKLAVYYSNEKQEIDITTFNKYLKLNNNLLHYPESLYYLNSIKYTENQFKKMMKLSIREDKKEWESSMHSYLGFMTSLQYVESTSRKHPFLC